MCITKWPTTANGVYQDISQTVCISSSMDVQDVVTQSEQMYFSMKMFNNRGDTIASVYNSLLLIYYTYANITLSSS